MSKQVKMATADKWFSRFIRLRDADENGYCTCCTCGKVDHFKSMDAGHFVNRKHRTTRFNERNVHAQCPYCNRYCEGNIPEYSIFMEKEYGKGIIEEMIDLKNKTIKMGAMQIQAISDEYREKTKALSKDKNINF